MEINEWVNNYVNDDDMWWRIHNDEYWNKRIYREEGRNDSKVEIAKKMLAKETPIAEISEITELSIEEIKNLQKNCN